MSREMLERQEIINDLSEQLRAVKAELHSNGNARHLLTRRMENAIAYLTSTSNPEPRIAAALTQLQQGLSGR